MERCGALQTWGVSAPLWTEARAPATQHARGVSARRGTAALASTPEVASTPGTQTTPVVPSLRRSHGVDAEGASPVHLTTSRLTPVMHDLTHKGLWYALDTSDRHPPADRCWRRGAVR